MPRSLFILLNCCLCAPVFFACATRSFPEPQVPLNEARNSIDRIQADYPDSMRLTAKIDYVDEVNAKRVVGQDVILSAQAPGNMRITISAFDKAISTLVSDGTGFSLVDVSQNVYVTGRATPENIAQILPVFLSAGDLYRVIYGMFPTDGVDDAALSTQTFEWDSNVGGYRRSLKMMNGQIENIYYTWPSGEIFKITVTDGSELLYVYEASDFKTYTFNNLSYRYPEVITFSLPPQKTDVRLRVDNRDFNVDFSQAVFRLLPPAGAKIIVLDPIPVPDLQSSDSQPVPDLQSSDSQPVPDLQSSDSQPVQDLQSSDSQPVQDLQSDMM